MNVRKLSTDRLPEAIVLLTNSFLEDPNFLAIYADPRQRRQVLPMLFDACLKDALAYGSVQTVMEQDELLGVAIWFPPHTLPMKPWRKFRFGLRFLPIILKAPAPTFRMISFTERLFKLHPASAFWYLEVLGVKQGHQGRGIGSALVRAVTALADQAHTPCYLETMNPGNVPLYERHGFKVTGSQVRITPAGAPAWLMWRPPVITGTI